MALATVHDERAALKLVAFAASPCPGHWVMAQTGVAKNKYADLRGQIALFARVVDLSDQYRQRHMLGMRDLFQVSPEGLFKADAGLVSTNYDGTFNDRGFH